MRRVGLLAGLAALLAVTASGGTVLAFENASSLPVGLVAQPSSAIVPQPSSAVAKPSSIIAQQSTAAPQPSSAVVQQTAATTLQAASVTAQQVQQTTPDSPTISALVGGFNSISINWNKPTSIDAADIEALEVRYIRSDEDDADKAIDANWGTERFDTEVTNTRLLTGLTTILRGLVIGVEYDVQIRLDVGTKSNWSTSMKATPKSPGNAASPRDADAVVLPANIGVVGLIGNSGDADHFKFTLAKKSEVILFTAGPDLTADGTFTAGTVTARGRLYQDKGQSLAASRIEESEPGGLQHGGNNFLIATTIPAGTYYVTVMDVYGNTGEYRLYYRSNADPSGSSDAREILVDSRANGVVETIQNRGNNQDCLDFTSSKFPKISTDRDFHKLELQAETNLHIYVRGNFDTEMILQKAGQVIHRNDDGLLGHSSDIAATLEAGTYIIIIKSFKCAVGGFYNLGVNPMESPGSTKAEATSVEIDDVVAGELNSATEKHYYSINLSSDQYLQLGFLSSNNNKPDIQVVVENSIGIPIIDFLWPAFDNDAYANVDRPDTIASYEGSLSAGDYFISVNVEAKGGPYALAFTDFGTFNSRYDERCLKQKDTRLSSPSDTHYGCQWHLKNRGQFIPPGQSYPRHDINIENVWADGITGEGVNVAIVDAGFNTNHVELRDSVDHGKNYNHLDPSRDISNPLNDHGTSVAGLIAANHNNIGVRGIAPDANIYGTNILDDPNFSLANKLLALKVQSRETAVSNNSWVVIRNGKHFKAEASWIRALEEGLEKGYYGKGTSYVFAAGNEWDDWEYDTNLYGYSNTWGTIPVCAIGLNDERSDYSNKGSTLWICAPSNSIVNRNTFSALRLEGLATTEGGRRYRQFGGTSAAAPIVTGVIALLRSINGDLDWRDIKLILAGSARKNNPGHAGWLSAGVKYGEESDKYNFNREYGFGAVDVEAAVDLAKSWKTLPLYLEATASSDLVPNVALNNSPTDFTEDTVTISSEMDFIEYVSIDVEYEHTHPRDLNFQLVSPSGNVTALTSPYYNSKLRQTSFDDTFVFGSARHLGEDPNGEWTLKVKDDVIQNPGGVLKAWKLTIYGHADSPRISGPTSIKYATHGTSFVAPYEVATYTATDPHNSGVIFALQGESKDLFEIDLSTGVLKFKQEPTFKRNAVYRLKVLALDGVHTGVRYVTIRFSDDPPVILTGSTTFDYDENGSTDVTIVAAVDPEGVTATLTLEGDDGDKFTITDGSISFALSPDFEAPTDADQDNSYEITVRASDGANEVTTVLVIEVKNVDEAGAVSFSVTQPAQGSQVTASLDDPDGSVSAATWSWFIKNGLDSCTNGSSDWAQISGANTHQYFPVLGDVNCLLRVRVSYTDAQGSGKSAEEAFTDPVASAGSAPTFAAAGNNANLYVRSVDENTAAGVAIGQPVVASDVDAGDSLEYSLEGADAQSFAIDSSTGQIRTKAPLDHEAQQRFMVTVTATDKFGHTASQQVTINVRNVNEPPRITSGKTQIDLVDGDVLNELYVAVEPEGRTITWSISGTDASEFAISASGNGASGRLNFSDPALARGEFPEGSTERYVINIRASDPAGNAAPLRRVVITAKGPEPPPPKPPPPDQPELPISTSTTTTTTSLPPRPPPRPTIFFDSSPANGPPVFDEPAPLRRSVVENAPLGTLIGDPITASDEEGDEVRYTLVGDHLDLFEVDVDTGQVVVKADAEIDFETRSSYTIVVVASDPDGSGESTEMEVFVNVEDEVVVGPAASYDANNNERIDLEELLEAFRDNLRRRLTRLQLIAVIRFYLRG